MVSNREQDHPFGYTWYFIKVETVGSNTRRTTTRVLVPAILRACLCEATSFHFNPPCPQPLNLGSLSAMLPYEQILKGQSMPFLSG